jgi:uncharacterized protein
MHKVYFRFYEELNDFLPESKKKKHFEHYYTDLASVKDMIEAFGIPHTEIDLILVNGKSVDFNYVINDGDNVSVYPVFESLDISDVQHLRPKPLRKPKFILDVHLGKLARSLRMLGFDVLYHNSYEDNEIVDISINEKRTILTRDKGILKQTKVTRGYYIRNEEVLNQTQEVVRRFHLLKEIKEFTRCLLCNGLLRPIKKEVVINQIPPKVAAWQDKFFRCMNCNKIYWQGTHHQKMNSFIHSIKNIEL